MAHSAILRESGCLVGRIISSAVVGQVAVDARCAGQGEIAVDVALRALHSCMRSDQCKPGRSMVEVGASPAGDGRVAGVARRWKSRALVRWIRGGVVLFEVAAEAVHRRAGELSSHVALSASDGDVSAG